MLPALVVSLALGTSLQDLNLDLKNHTYPIVHGLAAGLFDTPLLPMQTKFPAPVLTEEVKAALAREALEKVKAFITSDEGRALWRKELDPRGYFPSVVERWAYQNGDVAIWTTLVKERKPARPSDADHLAVQLARQRAFKAERMRLDQEEATRLKAVELHDDASFNAQLKERLTVFLAESKNMPFDAKLIDRNGRKYFADAALEAKPAWWKFCFRAGPAATKAARDFAAEWLAELH